MKDYAYTVNTGIRTSTTYNRNSPPVSSTSVGITKRTVNLVATNGLGGDPAHHLATSMSFRKKQSTIGDGITISGAGAFPYSVDVGAGYGSSMVPDPFYKTDRKSVV